MQLSDQTITAATARDLHVTVTQRLRDLTATLNLEKRRFVDKSRPAMRNHPHRVTESYVRDLATALTDWDLEFARLGVAATQLNRAPQFSNDEREVAATLVQAGRRTVAELTDLVHAHCVRMDISA